MKMEKTEEEKEKGEKEVFRIFRKTQTQTDMRAHRHTDRQTHNNIGIKRFFFFRSKAVILNYSLLLHFSITMYLRC